MDSSVPHKEKVLLIGLNSGQADYDYSMVELRKLAKANAMDVVGRIDQPLDEPNAATYFGSGKVQQVHDLVQTTGVTTVIANDELSPSQLKNLTDAIGVRIIDRTALILEIFAKRAQTKEAKLQVQIAKLQYQLPRLHTAANQVLDQQTGAGAGFANRGSGETQIELDRRVIQRQISHLRQELKDVQRSEEVKRSQRDKSAIPTAALVGYTNAGKSTIMNELLNKFGLVKDKQVFTKDMLFATLDTSVRQLTLPDQKRFLLSDTVGFVSKLPTHLIEAFKSTLQEAAKADLLIQVIDYSDPHRDDMIKTTEKTLAEIGINNVPMIYVFNKADKVNDTEYPTMEGDSRLIISAKHQESIDFLAKTVKDKLFSNYVQAELLIPFSKGQIVSYLNEHTNILNTDYQSDGTRLKVELSPEDLQRFSKYQV